MPRAVLYARVSGDDRTKTGGGNLADQLTLCREYAQVHGHRVIAELAEDDRGASGAAMDLPQLSRVLEIAQAGHFDVLVVRELDRLSRDLTKQLIVEQELMRAGVSIEYVLYDFPDTPEGRLNKNLRAMLAEYEREKIKQRMMRGRLRKVRDGEVINNGRPLFGYRNVKIDGRSALEIREEEAETVRLIYRWYTAGDGVSSPMSIRAISRRLTELQVPSYADLRNRNDCTAKTIAGRGHWGTSSVGKILAREAYAGTWYYGQSSKLRDPIAVTVPAIVDRETWDAAQRRRKRNKEKSKRNRKYEYLLAGHLTCAECGRKVGATPTRNPAGKLILYYYCQATKRGYSCPMGYTHFPAAEADRVVWDWIKDFLTDEAGLEQSLRDHQSQQKELMAPVRAQKLRISKQIQEKRRRLGRLLDLYLDGEYGRVGLGRRRRELEGELAGQVDRLLQADRQLSSEEFSEERLQTILAFAGAARAGIDEAEESFEKRRELLEAMDLSGELAVEDSEKVLYVHCVVGVFSAFFASTTGRNGGHKDGEGYRLSARFVL